eukprot:9956524-Alexandrium_andersonii.AAC.1
MSACAAAKHTAAGMDGWRPAELAVISTGPATWLAVLLNLVEEGRPWPSPFLRAKAAFLPKS